VKLNNAFKSNVYVAMLVAKRACPQLSVACKLDVIQM
jgi:hypothetical protein